jgi:hypothetical protein
VSVSVLYDLIQELDCFCKSGFWLSDPLKELDLPSRLHRVTQFFNFASADAECDPINSSENIDWLISIFAQIQVLVHPRFFSAARSRKRFVTKHLKAQISTTITTRFPPAKVQSIRESLKKDITAVKKELRKKSRSKKLKKKTSEAPDTFAASLDEISSIMGAEVPKAPFLDVGAQLFSSGRTKFVTTEEYLKAYNAYADFAARLAEEEVGSSALRNQLIGIS